MKLHCPLCGEAVPYDLSRAGQSVQCSYCEKPLKMPPFEELPEELQEELRQVAAKEEEKQKRRYRRKQERLLKTLEKEEQRKQRQQERQAEPAAAPIESRSSSKPLGIVLAAIYSAMGAWQFFNAYNTTSSVGGSLGGTGELLEGLQSESLKELLGGAGELLEGLGGGAAGGAAGGDGFSAVLFGLLAILFLVSALLLAAICYGLFTLQTWSYRLTFIAYGLTGAVAFLAILAGNSRQSVIQHLPNLIAAVLIIFYFSQPRVKAVFRREPGS